MNRILITGGSGFIGSHLIDYIIQNTDDYILNIDKLTYASNSIINLKYRDHKQYTFRKIDICNRQKLNEVIQEFKPTKVMHLAAESHVDRSIDQSSEFIQTNLVGTYNLLESARQYFMKLSLLDKNSFIFHHISTDEVYGDLPHPDDCEGDPPKFKESNPYAPSSPYSATKAGSDHLVRAWHRTYGLPIVLTNCSNNYGPYQHKEKLIPNTINKALNCKKIPVYGNGNQIRDWLYVKDHVKALYLIANKGRSGSTYNIGGDSEKRNIEVVRNICAILNELNPQKYKYEQLIEFVKDRPGHDRRYAIDSSLIKSELDWRAEEAFNSGLRKQFYGI